MLKNQQIWAVIITLGLLLILTNIPTAAHAEKSLKSINQFRLIEQPKGVRIGVTLGGLVLISTELWWFLFSKTKAQKSKNRNRIQQVDITVDGG